MARERTVTTHFFGVFARGRAERIERAQVAMREPTDGGHQVDRATRVVANYTLERFGVRPREQVKVRKARRDETGRWLVVATPRRADDE